MSWAALGRHAHVRARGARERVQAAAGAGLDALQVRPHIPAINFLFRSTDFFIKLPEVCEIGLLAS